ncbi:HAMP domain-containing histidine kinase [Halioglobus maricola]|uniref:histidine kinase n=1 Tax=Halioglobus maricola TaxID=2601894 RepID=A0A5P9NNT3_9GAMM|nr:ATP-binding protein [Halioglobus maricola]QFU76924.1 HAMP domain-containing histidine kinase [Halioglobus maricola]
MNQTTNHIASPALENLRSLLIIRSIALLGQIGVLCYVLYSSRTTEELWGMTASLVVLGLFTMLTFWRCSKSWPVSDGEFLAQLLIDVGAWTALMYFTGGANNPFISYYIVPLVVSAAVLPWRHTWLVAVASLLAYSLLLYFYRPFPLFTPHAHMGHGTNANVHILGMWFNFLFSAGLITYFVVRMAGQLRQQETRAVAQREDQLRNDQIMAVASLAAGTAHELGTPMATMTVLLDEMLADDTLSAQAREDCKLLQTQLQTCRSTLTELTRTAELKTTAESKPMPVDKFVEESIERWSVRRPTVSYQTVRLGEGSAPSIPYDPTLAQAFENLLNNAADAGSERVEVSVNWSSQHASITVRDWGTGISPDLLEDIGKPIIRASRAGLGIGLLLSHATVERYGGRVELRNAEDSGAIATLTLPIVDSSHD